MNNPVEYYKNKREEVAVFLPAQYSIVLEIGCGEGGFRSNLNEVQEYWGVEPVEAIAKHAQKRLDKVLVGTYEDVENLIPNNYFDLVICNDVIEHMPDHDKFLQSIKNKIKSNGCLVASVPNVRYIGNLMELLVRKDWRYKDEGILDRTHLRFFTMKSLIRTLNENEFSVEQIGGINSHQPRSLLKQLLYFIAIIIFGKDIKYLQFGIRVNKKQA